MGAAARYLPLALCALALAAGPAAAASSASHEAQPVVLNSGGRDFSSASHNAVAGAGAAGGTAQASASHELYPGFGNLMAWPATVAGFSASTGPAGGTVRLSWTSPAADGSTGTAAAYQLRLSSVQADSPALSETKFFLARSATEFVSVPAPGPAGYPEQLQIGGLVGGATYYFAVKAKASWHAWGYLSAGATAQARLFEPVPGAFSGVTEAAARLDWSDTANIGGLQYRVLVSTAPDPLAPNGAVVSSSDTYNLFLTTSGLSANTVYYFRVAAINTSSVPPLYSSAVGTSTLVAFPPLFSNFSAMGPASLQVVLSPNGNPDPGTDYRVLYSTAPDPHNPSGAAVFSAVSAGPTVPVTGLSADTTYYFSAAGVNHDGVTTSYTAAAGTSTLAAVPVFAGFSDVAAVSVRFNWALSGNRPTGDEPGTRYRVLASTAPDPLNPSGASVTSADTYELNFSSTGLVSDTDYYFRAAAINNNGVITAYSAPQKVTTIHVSSPYLWSVGTAVGATANTAVTWPPHQAGDLGLLFVEAPGTQAIGLTTPNGFAQLPTNSPQATTGALASSTRLAVYWCRATSGSMAAPVVTNPGNHFYGVILVFRGVADSGNPWDVSTGSVKNATSVSATVPDMTTTEHQTLVVTGLTSQVDAATAFASNWVNANLSNIAEVFDSGTTSGNGGGIAVITAGKEAAGATGNTTVTVVNSVNAFISLALRPRPPLLPPNPDAITGVAARSLSASWSLAAGATGYTLAASLAPDNPPAVYASSTTLGDLSATVDTPVLSPDTTYYLFVRANGPGESSAWSAYLGTSTLVEYSPASPAAPAAAASSVQFTWSANGNPANITRYRVLVSTAPDPGAPDGAVVTASDTYNLSLSTAGLAADTRYYFRAAGVNNNDVATAYTSPVSTYTLLAYPPAFMDFSGVSTGALAAGWSQNGNAAGTLYRAQLSTDPGLAGAVSYDTYATALSSAGLAANTTYYFRAAGVSKAGILTAYTAVSSTATLARSPASPAFGGVTGTSASLGWSADGNPFPATLYRVAVSTAPDPLSPAGAAVTFADTYALSLSSSGLALNTTYYFRAAAVNHGGQLSGWTAPLSTATLAAAPSSLAFTAVSSWSARLDWSQGANPAPSTRYRVVYSTAADPLAPAGAQAVETYTTGAYLDAAQLAANASYYFKVAAVGHGGTASAYAALSTATYAAAPAGFNFTAVSSWTARLNWSHEGNPAGETLYRVAVSTAPDPLNPGAAASNLYQTYNDYLQPPNLAANTTYYFRAAAVNRRGQSTAYPAAGSTSTLAAQPSGFYFTGTTQDQTLVNWDGSVNGPGTLYLVAVSTAPDPLAPAGAQVTQHQTYDAYLSTGGLAYFTDYYFRAAAVNNNGVTTAYSAPVSEKTLAPGEIGSPASGGVDGVFVSSIAASWSLVSGATGYTLAASLSPDNPPTAIAASSVTVGNAAAAAHALSLAADTTYYLFVRANGPMSAGAWYAFPGAATRVEFEPLPGAYSAVGQAAARFNWAHNGNPAGTQYRVVSSTAADPLAPAGAVAVSSDTYNIYLDSAGLAANTTYYFRVAGLNKGGLLTDYSAVSGTSTLAAAPAASAFSGLSASAMQFDWSGGVNPAGTLYRVVSSTAADPLNPVGAAAVSSDTYNLFLSSSGLAADTSYYFRVAAMNHNGVYTAYTAAASTATRLAAAPAFGSFGSVTAAAVQLSWTDTNPAGTLYRVFSSTAPDPLNPAGAAAVSSYTYNLSLSSAGLAANTTYYFRIAAVNKSLYPTAYTAAAGTATLANLPVSAASTFSAVTESGFTAGWLPNNNPAGTLYQVEASTAADFNAGAAYRHAAATAPSAGYSYSFSGLRPDTVYFFQVRAVNRNGVAGGYAQLGSTRTLTLPSPAVSGIVAVTSDTVSAAWALSAGATGYTLAASTAPQNPPYPVAASSDTLSGSSALLSGLDVNTTYFLFVRADGAGMSSAWSAFQATATLANQPLTAASTFSAVGYDDFFVSWNANSNPMGSTAYEAEVSTAFNFNAGVTDRVSFSTAPAAGPGAFFDAVSAGAFYYFRVRALGHGGAATPWTELGVVHTKALPTLHAAGDGVVFYGQAGNVLPQFRHYYGASNSFSGVAETVSGEAGQLYTIKTNPLQSKQEALAAYVKDGTLHVLCTDGTNWSEEWTQAVGGTAATRRFDIAFETNSGDAMVVYSQNQGAANELGYRTKSGSLDCGAGGWSAHNDLDPVRTSGVVQWVKLASDRRASSDTLVAVWADAGGALSARIWGGAAWESEPSAALSAALENVAAAQDVEDFDAEFESLTGNAMVVWADPAGNTTTNGMRYARWLEASRTWGSPTDPGATGDDATNLDLAANPASNEMVFASVGNAGGAGSADARAWYWSGSAWTIAALDTASQLPSAGTRMIAAGWVSSGTFTRSVITYHDAATTNIGWYVGNGATFTLQTATSVPPAFAVPQAVYDLKQDPVNKDRLLFTVSDARKYLYAKRVVMNASGVFSWTDANGGFPLETALSTGSIGGFGFAYWAAPPVTTFAQSAYRLYANADGANVGAPLAAQDAVAALATAGSAFRLRAALHVAQVDLPLGGQAFKLQFAGRGTGTCDAPANGTPADYVDVGAGTEIAFNDNAAPADGAALTVNAADPKHGGHVNSAQTYEEANNFTNSVSGVTRSQDALWDFSLKDNGMVPGAVYCLRVLKADGSALNSYDVYPEVMVNAPVYINEVYPSGAAGADWAELYNNTASTPSLAGWRFEYVENTIDTGGTPAVLWTGVPGDVINAGSTFTLTGLSLVGTQSYNVRLLDAANRLVDQVQWPVLSAGQSFARITDGNPSYFEIDPTPTPGYANAVSTDPYRINEVSYGAAGPQFVELYNGSSVSTLTPVGYTLRSSAGASRGVFTLDRKLYPRGYALVGAASSDKNGRTFQDAFGPQGLAPGGDFLALENSSGSVVDAVTWQADANFTRYNYKASTVSYTAPAPANSAYAIARGAQEGDDSGVDQVDFTARAAATPGGRNNGSGGSPSANTLSYPVNTSSPQTLSRRFPLRLTLGADWSAGGSNNLVFERTGGAADAGSPHIYRLADIGFTLSSLLPQATVHAGLTFADQDGRPLAGGAVYRVTLNTDDGAVSAAPITLSTVTFDSGVHAVTASTAAPAKMSNATRAAMGRLTVSNNGLSGGNAVVLTTVTFSLLDPDLLPFGEAPARGLFEALMLVGDSAGGLAGTYEPGIDVATAAYVPMGDISVDQNGLSTFTVAQQYFSSASVASASSRSFYIVFESTRNASDRAAKVFRVRFSGASAGMMDAAGLLPQDFSPSAQVETSSVSLISPAQPPAASSWPYVTPSSAPISTLAGTEMTGLVSVRSYIGSTDGHLRAVGGGDLIWDFVTSPLSPINSSPTDSITEGGAAYIYFADDNGNVYKLRDNGASYTQIWKRSIGAQVRSNITVSGDRLYFGAADNKVHCVDKTTAGGADCGGWTDLAVGGTLSGTPMVDDRTGVNSSWIGTESGALVQLNTGSGGSVNSFNTGSAVKSSPFGDVAWGGSTNKLFITSTDGRLYVAPLDLGSEEHPFNAGAAIYTSPFVWSFSGTRYVFFGDEAGRLHKVSTQTWNEPAGWPFQAGGAIRSGPVVMPYDPLYGPADGQDYLYFGSDDGYIYAVNINTGQLRPGWPVATGGPVRADPVIDTAEMTLTVGSNDGRTYVLSVGP